MTTVASRDRYIEIATECGTVTMRSHGQGPYLIVLHGGPGLDHTYLYDALLPLGQERTLVFYDQLGCSASPPSCPINANNTVHELLSIITRLSTDKPVGILAHSWGSLLVLSALETIHRDVLRELYFVCPCPITIDHHRAAFHRLSNRVPGAVRRQLDDLPQERTYEAMKLLWPYYAGRRPNIVDHPPMPYNALIHALVMGTLGDFDFTAATAYIPRRSSVILGECDFIVQEDVSDLCNAVSELVIIRDAGHFPFIEAPDDFAAVMMQCLTLNP
jgi:proline iminopeptidase